MTGGAAPTIPDDGPHPQAAGGGGRSLVTRLGAVILAVGLLAGLLGAVVIRASASTALRNEVEDVNVGVADRLATALDARIHSLQESLELLATRTGVVDLQPDTNELAVALRALEEIDELILYAGDGVPVAAAAAGDLLRPSDLDPRPGLADEVAGPSSTGVLVLERPTLEVRAVVENPPGNVAGVLVARTPLELVTGDLQARFLGTTATAFVAAPDGRILVHPERDRVVEGQAFPIGSVLAEHNRVGELTHEGTDLVVAASEPPGLPVVVAVSQTRQEAFARVGDQVGELSLILALVIGAVTVAVLTAAGSLLRPLRNLALTVRRLGEGDRSARAEPRGSSEIRTVAVEVNRMADALEERLQKLEAARREQREAEERFRTAFSEAPLAMAITTLDGEYIDVNPAFCELLGRTEAETVGHTWREFTHRDDLEASEEALRAATHERRRAYSLEKRYLRPDGSPVWVLLTNAVAGGHDQPRYFIAQILDLSDRRRAEEEREQYFRQALAAEERGRIILEAAPDATLLVDHEGNIEFVNHQVRTLFGYEPDEIVGQPVEMLVPEHAREVHVSHRSDYATEPQTRRMGSGLELSGRRKDGTEFPIEVSLSPLQVEGGLMVVASVRDVTDRRRAEETERTLREMRSRQRQAMEVNDNIVQGLTIAKWAFELDRLDSARSAVGRTLESARSLVNQMLSEGTAGEVEPGSLVREHPAEFPR